MKHDVLGVNIGLEDGIDPGKSQGASAIRLRLADEIRDSEADARSVARPLFRYRKKIKTHWDFFDMVNYPEDLCGAQYHHALSSTGKKGAPA